MPLYLDDDAEAGYLDDHFDVIYVQRNDHGDWDVFADQDGGEVFDSYPEHVLEMVADPRGEYSVKVCHRHTGEPWTPSSQPVGS